MENEILVESAATPEQIETLLIILPPVKLPSEVQFTPSIFAVIRFEMLGVEEPPSESSFLQELNPTSAIPTIKVKILIFIIDFLGWSKCN